MQKMKIGILGTGDVGKALGKGFLAQGCEVKMGSREANNPKGQEWAKVSGPKASAGTFADAVKFGDVIVLATVGTAALEVLQGVGADAFAGKVVIDATNPLKFGAKGPELSVGWNDSLGEQVQRAIPKARVVKAFNSVGNAHMVNPSFPGGPPDMFIAGNDADAKKTVTEICKAFGWGVIDSGDIEASRLLEPLCILWVAYAQRTGGWNHAFKMLKR